MWALTNELVLFLQIRNCFSYVTYNEIEGYILGWNTYIASLWKHQSGCAIIRKNFSLTYMMTIEPTTSWFGIAEIPTFDIDEVTTSNDEYIDKKFCQG